MSIESIYTPLLKEYDLAEKVSFTPEEFELLEDKYMQLLELENKIQHKASAQNILDNANASVTSIQAQIADIGTLPETAPESLSERYGWIGLKNQKENLEVQLQNAQATITSYTEQISTLDSEISAIKTSLGIA